VRLSARALLGAGLVAAAFVGLAWLLGLPELTAVALAGFLGLLGAAAWLVAHPSRPELHLLTTPRAVRVGGSATLVVRATNREARRTPPIRVIGSLSTAGEGILAVAPLEPGQSVEARIRLDAPRRGIVAAGPLRVVASDPLGLWASTTTSEASSRLIIHPDVHPVPSIGRGAGPRRALTGPPGPGPAGGAEGDVAGLRPYVRGDDLRLVHWRTSARRGHPHVVQVEPPAAAPTLGVVLHNEAHSCDPDAFERAVQAAASLLAHAGARGHALRLVTSEGADTGRLDADGIDTALDLLAGVHLVTGGDLGRALLAVTSEAPAGDTWGGGAGGDPSVVVCTAAVAPLGRAASQAVRPGGAPPSVLACGAEPPPGTADLLGHWTGEGSLDEALRRAAVVPA
jgi:uncharacterized protein (DUF58 family)